MVQIVGPTCYHMASKGAMALASAPSPARDPLTGVSDAASEQASERRPGKPRRPGVSPGDPLDAAGPGRGDSGFRHGGSGGPAPGPPPRHPQHATLSAARALPPVVDASY